MLVLVLILVALEASGELDAPWRAFHEAGDPGGREVAWAELRRRGWPDDFDRTLARLRARTYASDVPTGIVREERVDLDGRRFRTTTLVPESYDPERAYPVQVVLHGSTRRPPWRDDEEHWRWLAPFRSEDVITVFPAAWDDAMWWTQRQVDNLRAILDRLRGRYHVDPDRCYLTGLSDGGTGTLYHAMRAPTPWAAFLPLIGHPWVLGNAAEGVDGDVFAANLHGRALLIVNAEDDPLYPAAALAPYLGLFERAGAHVESKVKPGGHTVRWWPEESESFRAFRTAHVRDPFPAVVVWETDDPDDNGRAGWVIVDAIGDAPALDPDPLNTVLFPELDPPTRAEAFPRTRPSGRVTVRRAGQKVVVETRNVRRLRLLVGVDVFDLARPIEVHVDGVASRHDVVPSVATLMEWAIVDGDPAQLVAAEIDLEISP